MPFRGPPSSKGPGTYPSVLRRGGRKGRTKAGRLRVALEAIGRPYVCEGCGNRGYWRGRPLGLEIDHIDGDRLNNLAENLRFLCPNCHRTTPTWGPGGR